MEYSNSFKKKVFNIFRGRPDFRKIIHNIENGNHNEVRKCIEDAYDDPSFYNGVDEEGKPKIADSKTHLFERVRELYTEFSYNYEQYLDKIQNNEPVLSK